MKTIAVDVDGTITEPVDDGEFDVTKFQNVLPGAIEALQKLRDDGWHIILHTCRGTASMNDKNADVLRVIIAQWADEHDVSYDDVWVGEGKPLADVYLDDRAVVFNGNWDEALDRIEKLNV